MKIEWEYLVLILICTFLALTLWTRGIISDIHMLFMIGGGILTLIALTAFPIEIGKTNLSNFLLQTAIGNIILGFPAIRGIPPTAFLIPKPEVLLVAVATEEALRIGAFHLTLESFEMSTFATFVGGIVFAAMHIYWFPTQWLYAIAGGALFSVLLLMFHSQTACIVTHFGHDLLMFGMLPFLPYMIISVVMLIISQIPRLKKVEI